MAPKRKPSKQKSLNVEQLKLLKKPLDHLGKLIDIPGSFWQGRQSADERKNMYKCAIVDFSLAQRFSEDSPPQQAFFMQEMGVDGTGSLEKSDLDSTKFWMAYPSPFLKYYYQTFPFLGLLGVEPLFGVARSIASGGQVSTSTRSS